jgi:phosphotransferase system HPr (HPr) family protein
MRADEIEVRNPSGLHARPAALFVKTAARFTSTVTVQNVTTGAGPANAKSILAVMGSGAARGHVVRITADGPDEEQAISVLHDLFASGLGEDLEA